MATPKEIADGYCEERSDATHCTHWWDDAGPCCSCGDDSHPEWVR